MLADLLKIYTNSRFPAAAHDLLLAGLAPHTLTDSLADADIAFGQPDAVSAMHNPRLRWIHVSSAGYTR